MQSAFKLLNAGLDISVIGGRLGQTSLRMEVFGLTLVMGGRALGSTLRLLRGTTHGLLLPVYSSALMMSNSSPSLQ
jgi:hypothetical protein